MEDREEHHEEHPMASTASFRLALLQSAAMLAVAGLAPSVTAQVVCEGFGPQAPRDIVAAAGENTARFSLAPPASAMSLCNIHAHRSAEHRGPGFSTEAPDGSGYICNATRDLTDAKRAPLEGGPNAFGDVAPGDTIEVHWVFTSCDVEPGPGLTSCSSAECANPELRVESQVFLVVNDEAAAGTVAAMSDYALAEGGDLPQPRALPDGEPVVYGGSTTGPTYSEQICSPLGVTWSVRPECARLSARSLRDWAESDPVFDEHHAHGVRALVTDPRLLSGIN
jgi:Delta carbonic anhydrase